MTCGWMRSTVGRAGACGALLALGAVTGVAAPVPAVAEPVACPDEIVPLGAFPDTAGTTHGAAVDCVAWRGITKGMSVVAYGASAPVRRDQMATFLVRMIEAADAPLPDSPGLVFPDAAGNAHEPSIARLAGAGIAAGVTPVRYAPADPVRRDQMASLLVRTLEYVTGAPLETGAGAFSDDDGNVHEAAIDKLARAGVTTGVAPERYEPGRTLRREQMASFLARSLEVLAAGGHLQPLDTASPAFDGASQPLPSGLRGTMIGSSWRPGCPVDLDDLALLTMNHRGFDGRVHRGWMVVAEDVADDVLAVFRSIFDAGFPLQRMWLIDEYGGSDDRSMAANNTSAFNCRRVTGGAGFSQHAYGTAIDVNPVQNPYVRGDTVLPAAGARYLDRTDERGGMILGNGPVVRAFAGAGWAWGGNYRSLKDYQHFSRSGG